MQALETFIRRLLPLAWGDDREAELGLALSGPGRLLFSLDCESGIVQRGRCCSDGMEKWAEQQQSYHKVGEIADNPPVPSINGMVTSEEAHHAARATRVQHAFFNLGGYDIRNLHIHTEHLPRRMPNDDTLDLGTLHDCHLSSHTTSPEDGHLVLSYDRSITKFWLMNVRYTQAPDSIPSPSDGFAVRTNIRPSHGSDLVDFGGWVGPHGYYLDASEHPSWHQGYVGTIHWDIATFIDMPWCQGRGDERVFKCKAAAD